MSDQTAEMIRKVAVELGYEPRPAARSLVTYRTGVLGLALPCDAAFWDGNPFNDAILRGATDAAGRLGLDLLLHTRRQQAWQQRDTASLMNLAADGVLPVVPADQSPVLSALAESDYAPAAAVCDPEQCPLPCVNADDAGGARAAVTYLSRLGHRRIGHLAGPDALGLSRSRARGYREALTSAGLETSERLVARAPADASGGYRATVELVAHQPRPTAVFAFNDLIARGAIEALRQMRLNVPAQVSVVGLDDAPFAADLDPPLTTVHYPARDIAGAALEILARLTRVGTDASGARSAESRAETAPLGRTALFLPTRLVVRQSAAPPTGDSSL